MSEEFLEFAPECSHDEVSDYIRLAVHTLGHVMSHGKESILFTHAELNDEIKNTVKLCFGSCTYEPCLPFFACYGPF